MNDRECGREEAAGDFKGRAKSASCEAVFADSVN
jgi:hypothetical protein